MKIGNFDTHAKVFVIAEIGNNHEGDFGLAREMIGRAAEAGADAVKFQTIVPERLVQPSETERIARLRAFQFSYDQFAELAEVAERAGVVFFSTPFDLESAAFLNDIQPVFKIASGDNTFVPLIDRVAGFGKPMIVSTGLADMMLVESIHHCISAKWASAGISPGLVLLHCVASYPTPDEQAGLGGIAALKRRFPEVTAGYSDHTLGIDAATYAVAAGARVIEKHFTLDKNHSDFRDHQLSADPEDMRRMVAAIRRVETMLGVGDKAPQPCEEGAALALRRSIAAARPLPAGTVLVGRDLIWIRPGSGIAPGGEAGVIGRTVKHDLQPGEIIMPDSLD